MAQTKKKMRENLNGMKEGELVRELGLLEEKKRLIRFKAEGSKSKNVKELANLRKDVARILTKMNSKNQK